MIAVGVGEDSPIPAGNNGAGTAGLIGVGGLAYGDDSSVTVLNDSSGNVNAGLAGALGVGIGDGNTISGNDISDTSACPPDPCGFGVAIAGGDGNVVAANQVARTALDGIAVVALDPGDTTSNTLLRDNFVRASAHDDHSVGAVGAGTVTDTRLAGNLALTAAGDGFDIFTAGTTLTRNKAFADGNRGFEAVAGTIDGGGNLVHGNGNPAQCTGVVCG